MATPTLSPAVAAPAGDRRRAGDRRAGPADRRHARRDRRRAEHPVRVERRGAVADRRSGRPNRRLGGDRRGVSRPPTGPPLVDPDVVFWAVNVITWTAVTVVALIYGA